MRFNCTNQTSNFNQYETETRISAKDALHHQTFKPLGMDIYQLKDGKSGYGLYRFNNQFSEESLFSIKEVQITQNPGGSRNAKAGGNRNRRQSMLF